jgi:hypothetical protein
MSDLRSLLIARASQHSAFLASAFAAWRTGRPEVDLSDLLGCAPDDLWRVELAPRPREHAEFATSVRALANSFGLNVAGLIQVLRFADTISTLSSSGANDGHGLLLAARDDVRGSPPDDGDE